MYWLAYQTADDMCVVIMEAPSLIHARMVLAIQGNSEPGDFSEGHLLDPKLAKHVPSNMLGRCLSSREAQKLLKRLSGGR